MRKSKKKVVNLTPHQINVFAGGRLVLTAEPSGAVARCPLTKKAAGDVNGAPVYRMEAGYPTGLPAPEEGTVYIVSKIVAEALKGSRPDVLTVGSAVRDQSGRTIGCDGLSLI